jgi:GAF domain-containing protein
LFFKIDILPRHENDVKITFLIQSDSWLAALKIGLKELGIEESLVRRVDAEVERPGVVRVSDPLSGRVFIVSEHEPPRTPENQPDLFAGGAEAKATATVLAAATDTLAHLTAEEVLEESALEHYFEPEDVPSVRAEIRRDQSPAPADTHAPAPAPQAAPAPQPVPQAVRTAIATPPPLESPKAPAPQPAPDERVKLVRDSLRNLDTYLEDRDGALDLAVSLLERQLPAGVVAVLLPDKSRKNLVFGGLVGDFPKKLWKYRYPHGVGLAWIAVERGVALRVGRADRDPVFQKALADETGLRVQSALVAPLLSDERPRGVLMAVRADVEAGPFTEADLRLFELAAQSLADFLAFQETL